VLFYLLYLLYFDLGQVQVKSSPMEDPYAASTSSPTMRSLLPCQSGKYAPSLSLSLFI
jgi:hypothetical protein